MSTTTPRAYTAHSRITDPGRHAAWLATLPRDLPALHAAINGVLIHVWKIQVHHPRLLGDGRHNVFTRHIERLLDAMAAMDDRSLSVERPVERRAIVDCRHFSTVLCSVLRGRGIPARARCGFATYLEDTHLQDHWICEVWSADHGCWVMEDADLQRHDVPPEEFITGARAWQMCRAAPEMADRFGYDAGTRGMFTVRANHVRDFAALNGFESVSGDAWGLALVDDDNLTPENLLLLDRAAALAVNDDDLEALKSLYAQSGTLCVPPVIQHYDYLDANAWRAETWEQEP